MPKTQSSITMRSPLSVFLGIFMILLMSYLPLETCLGQGENKSRAIKTALSCDVRQIIPGKPFKLFVDFVIEPGWHIYYKNPGQTGLPTKVEWNLPPGFDAQALSWPDAETFKESGIETYGYSKSMRLSTVVTPPKNLKAGESITIKATATWLACKHSCIPGSSSMTVALKIQTK